MISCDRDFSNTVYHFRKASRAFFAVLNVMNTFYALVTIVRVNSWWIDETDKILSYKLNAKIRPTAWGLFRQCDVH